MCAAMIPYETARLSILMDNQAIPGLAAEHGFSLYIEADGRRILFDTGQTEALIHNAHTLGIDFKNIDDLVLSHGHYDHTGCVAEVISTAESVHLYCHPAAARHRYALQHGLSRAIHMPQTAKAALSALPSERFHKVTQPTSLSGCITLSGPIPRETDFEDAGGSFFLDTDGETPDDIEDDLALWVSTTRGLVVATGCCHAGVVNTLRHVHRTHPDAPIHAIIGGFHLLNAAPQRLEPTIAELAAIDVEHIIACHCTGDRAIRTLKTALGERVSVGAAGKTYLF